MADAEINDVYFKLADKYVLPIYYIQNECHKFRDLKRNVLGCIF